jgi:capsular polysaccharide biosynthesis protein
MKLSLRDEFEVLTKVHSVDSFVAPDTIAGQVRVLAGDVCASAACGARIGTSGGAPIADLDGDQAIRRADVHLFRATNVFYLPGLGVIIAQDGTVMRASFGEADFLLQGIKNLPFAREADGSVLFEPPKDVEIVERAVVTCPWGAIENYGHWLLDCMPGVAVTNLYPIIGGYRHIFPPLKPWQRRHLQLAGVTDPLELNGEIYLLRDVVWHSCMDHFLHSPNQNLVALRDIQLHNVAPSMNGALRRRLYLTRRDGPKRPFPLEKLLEERLESTLGFTIINPANFSIDEQIAMFQAADVVVGPSGAAFANVLYCPPSTKVIEIMTPLLSGIWVRNLAVLIGCEWSYFNYKYGSAAEANEAEHLQTINELLNYVSTIIAADRERKWVGCSGHRDTEDEITPEGDMIKTENHFWRIPEHTGPDYTAVLGRLHDCLRPKRYLEIGTLNGETLALCKCDSIAIDPEFKKLKEDALNKEVVLLFRMTSDAFFSSYSPSALLGGPLDMAFIDGMHLYEFVLRDFINVEKHCRTNSLIILHDCIPTDACVARRDFGDVTLNALSDHSSWWAGDAWKAALIIRKVRPDLKFFSFDAGPTGLVVITGLDPSSLALERAYFDTVSEYKNVSMEQVKTESFLSNINYAKYDPAENSISGMFWL